MIEHMPINIAIIAIDSGFLAKYFAVAAGMINSAVIIKAPTNFIAIPIVNASSMVTIVQLLLHR